MLLVVRTKDRLIETLNVFPKALGLSVSKTTPIKVDIPVQSQAVVITSAQALKSLKHKIFPLICVGEKTAKIAREKGFNVSITGKGSAADLAQTMLNTHVLFDHICHVHGDTANLSWHKILQKAGVKIFSVEGYKTTYMQKLPKNIEENLRNGVITKIALFSRKSAEHLISLLNQASIDLSKIKVICFSQQIALVAKGFKTVLVATSPTVSAMKKHIEKG